MDENLNKIKNFFKDDLVLSYVNIIAKPKNYEKEIIYAKYTYSCYTFIISMDIYILSDSDIYHGKDLYCSLFDNRTGTLMKLPLRNVYKSVEIDSENLNSYEKLKKKFNMILNEKIIDENFEDIYELEKNILNVFIQFVFYLYIGYLYKNCDNLILDDKEEKLLLEFI